MPVFADPTAIGTLPALSAGEGSERSESVSLPASQEEDTLDAAELTLTACTERSECVPATQGVPIQSDPPQTPNTKETEMITDIPGSTGTNEPDQPEPELPCLEDFDPHTQRVIYMALANAPERGLGPNTFFAARPVTLQACQTVALPARQINDSTDEPDEPCVSKPAKRRPAKEINLNRHESHCTICNHPERDAIDEAFLHWWRATDLAYHFKLGNRLVVYRHAHAVGLFERRTARTQHALGYIIEQAETCTPTADSIIRAVRALGCIDQNGRWHEPRKEVLITHQYIESPTQNLPSAG